MSNTDKFINDRDQQNFGLKRKTIIVILMFFSLKDRAHKDEKDFRRHANIQELVTLKESEKHLQHELERIKELLKIEQQNHRETLAKVF